MASLSLHRISLNTLPFPRKVQHHPSSSPPYQLHFTFQPRTPISCTSKKLTDAALSSELAAELAKLNIQKAQKQEAMKKSREVLFSEICKSVSFKEEEMRKKWRRMEEEERWGLVKEFVGHWGARFQPLSARSVKEMIEEYLNEVEDKEGSRSNGGSSFFPGLKRLMGFPEDM
ncbi:uncharacterized protein LOC116196385 [Punica granatum]|uniref:DUF7026 domain-containing protein n=2 Tax=Punica granatum TaxID=22663 RepID=A0A218VTN2_PUNGR|nr:uncharacterized protein LOC116196385 [Punica granatum]OWM63693.1 hypothetical protein CDL15_Pgr008236 [Punica granatum]PKI33720.1 hypothetical protein CRG98_045882 [Punica granatum]